MAEMRKERVIHKLILVITAFIFVLIGTVSLAENHYIQIEPFSEGFAAVQNEDELWGYIDQTAKLVIPCEWKKAGPFTNGIASVKKGYKYGCINRNGELIIPCVWDGYTTLSFSEGLAPVQKDEYLWGYVDLKGDVVVECKWENYFASEFSEGLAAVRKDEMMGYINAAGEMVIPCQYIDASSFSYGYARVQDEKGLFFINKNGEEAFPQFPRAIGCDSFREDGIAYLVFEDFSSVFINTEGKIVCSLPRELQYRSNFREGLAGVATSNESGEYIGCEGYIDQTGEIVIPLELYGSFNSFTNGVTSIPDRRLIAGEKEVRYGIIDRSGRLVYPYLLEEAVEFDEPVTEAKQDGHEGAINTSGEVVVPFIYDSVRVGDGIVLCLKDGELSMFDYSGKGIN